MNVKMILETLKNRKTCILTDLTSHIQHRKILKLGLQAYIDYIVTSEEVGADKPSEMMFKAALKKMSLQPHEVCMIGDSFEKDIIGANNYGIFGFWYRPSPTEENHITKTGNFTSFTNFKELEGHLQ